MTMAILVSKDSVFCNPFLFGVVCFCLLTFAGNQGVNADRPMDANRATVTDYGHKLTVGHTPERTGRHTVRGMVPGEVAFLHGFDGKVAYKTTSNGSQKQTWLMETQRREKKLKHGKTKALDSAMGVVTLHAGKSEEYPVATVNRHQAHEDVEAPMVVQALIPKNQLGGLESKSGKYHVVERHRNYVSLARWNNLRKEDSLEIRALDGKLIATISKKSKELAVINPEMGGVVELPLTHTGVINFTATDSEDVKQQRFYFDENGFHAPGASVAMNRAEDLNTIDTASFGIGTGLANNAPGNDQDSHGFITLPNRTFNAVIVDGVSMVMSKDENLVKAEDSGWLAKEIVTEYLKQSQVRGGHSYGITPRIRKFVNQSLQQTAKRNGHGASDATASTLQFVDGINNTQHVANMKLDSIGGESKKGLGDAVMSAYKIDPKSRKLLVGHMGDTRVYVFSPNKGRRLVTKDQSVENRVWNHVRNSAGRGKSHRQSTAEFIEYGLENGDVVVAITDGVIDAIGEDNFESLVSKLVKEGRTAEYINKVLYSAVNGEIQNRQGRGDYADAATCIVSKVRDN